MDIYDSVVSALLKLFPKSPPAVVRTAGLAPGPSGENAVQVAKAAAKDPLVWGDDPHEALLNAWLGKSEVDDKDRAALKAFFKANMGLDVDPKTTAWCAAMANSVLGANNMGGTGALLARSFLTYGEAVDKDDPSKWQAGDIAVFSRGTSTWEGHVTFIKSWFTADDGPVFLRCIGGNQNNKVCEQTYPAKKLLGVRRGVSKNPVPPEPESPAKPTRKRSPKS